MTEPPQPAERRLSIDDALARLARVDIVFKIPPAMSPDEDPLSVLGTILGGGRSSRLNEQIVREKQLASNVFAFAGTNRGPGLFRVIATAGPGKSVADIEAAIDEEIRKISSEPVAEWEMEKARTSARSSFVSSVQSTLSRGILLSQYALFYNDPNLINTRAERIAKVTPQDVQRVARQYLTRENRTVVITNPKAAKTNGGGQ